ncbi:glycosyltransferase [Opitutales bacterium ASA1]|uniref:glycosyltransferase family protein n=1 Tax=Congregicoccus parvus TaxID=3081749 RepID=UPI002B2B7CDA|nr:glycosyltransferase [Opitutales bacterium ASA1]
MSRICLIKGQSQYDTTRTLLDRLGTVWSRTGHEVHVVDLVDSNWPAAMGEAFSAEVAFVFSFNAVGMDIATESGSIYEQAGTTFVTSLMDHPVYHLERLRTAVRGAVIGCVDRTHVRFVRSHFKGTRSAAFLPHAGMAVRGETTPMNRRTIDVLFSGTYVDPDSVRKAWTEAPAAVRRIYDGVAEHLLADPTCSLVQGVEAVLEREGLAPEDTLHAALLANITPVDTFVRASRRRDALSALVEAGVPLDLVGDSWENSSFARAPRVRAHPAVPYPILLEWMQRARVVLNVLPAFPDGSHDRVFCACLSGAVCASDENPYLRETFPDDDSIVFFPTRSPEALADTLATLLRDDASLQVVADRGRAVCETAHTWENRTARITELVEASRILGALRDG